MLYRYFKLNFLFSLANLIILKPYWTRVVRGFKLPELLERISFPNQEVSGMDFNVKELVE